MKNEEKKANFKRVAVKRTTKILTAINGLKAFTNKAFYRYSYSDIRKIIESIRTATDDLEAYYFKNNNKAFTLEEKEPKK